MPSNGGVEVVPDESFVTLYVEALEISSSSSDGLLVAAQWAVSSAGGRGGPPGHTTLARSRPFYLCSPLSELNFISFLVASSRAVLNERCHAQLSLVAVGGADTEPGRVLAQSPVIAVERLLFGDCPSPTAVDAATLSAKLRCSLIALSAINEQLDVMTMSVFAAGQPRWLPSSDQFCRTQIKPCFLLETAADAQAGRVYDHLFPAGFGSMLSSQHASILTDPDSAGAEDHDSLSPGYSEHRHSTSPGNAKVDDRHFAVLGSAADAPVYAVTKLNSPHGKSP